MAGNAQVHAAAALHRVSSPRRGTWSAALPSGTRQVPPPGTAARPAVRLLRLFVTWANLQLLHRVLASSPRARMRRQGPSLRPPMSHDGWALECEPTSRWLARYGVNRGRSTGTVSGTQVAIVSRVRGTGSQTEMEVLYCTVGRASTKYEYYSYHQLPGHSLSAGPARRPMAWHVKETL